MLFAVCALPSFAASEPVSIGRPVWSNGDTWRVKCPILTYSKYGASVTDYYTLVVEVMGNEKARDTECFVLRISSQPDFSKSGELNTRYESYVYYRRTDLAVRRIRTNIWRDDKLTSSDDYGWRGEAETTFGLEASYPTMPITMPMFPVMSTGSVERYHKDFEQKQRSSSTPVDQVPDEDRVVSTKTTEARAAATPSEIVAGAAPSQSAIGAVTVQFVQTNTYAKSADRENRRLTETWAPGHKWWISARSGDGDQRRIGTYILDDSPDPAPSK